MHVCVCLGIQHVQSVCDFHSRLVSTDIVDELTVQGC